MGCDWQGESMVVREMVKGEIRGRRDAEREKNCQHPYFKMIIFY